MRPLVVVWALGSLLLGGLILQDSVSDSVLMLDPTTTGRLPWYTGLVSNLGILAWATATTAAAGGAYVATLGQRRGAASFLRGGALLSTILLLDDLFQVHILIYAQTPLPKSAAYFVYVILTVAWIGTQHVELRRARWHLLVAAGSAFAAAIVIDIASATPTSALIAEDATKFLGVLAWATFFVMTARDIAASVLVQSQESAPVVQASVG